MDRTQEKREKLIAACGAAAVGLFYLGLFTALLYPAADVLRQLT